MELSLESIRQTDLDAFRQILLGVLNDRLPPNIDFFKNVTKIVLQVYADENPDIRLRTHADMPGGLLDLRSDKPVLILPDLHARRKFIRDLIDYVPSDRIQAAAVGCVGDSEDSDDTETNADLSPTEDGQVSDIGGGVDAAVAETDDSLLQEHTSDSVSECDDENVTAEEASYNSQSDEISSEEQTDMSESEQVSVMDYEPPQDVIPQSEQTAAAAKEDLDETDSLLAQLRSIRESARALIDDMEKAELERQKQKAELEAAAAAAQVSKCEDKVLTVQNVSDGDGDISQNVNDTGNITNTYTPLTVLELLEHGLINVLCVGDGVHSEAQHAQRWYNAYDEFLGGFELCPNMDAEIADSFNLMIAVMLLKIRYTDNFHFLKGNHENIRNETGGGNYAFVKFVYEGDMVLSYFQTHYDEELLTLYDDFEKSLPLFAVGRNFLASHAEPSTFYDFDHILNCRINEDVVLGLTWTDNYQSMPGTIDVMLDYYIPDNDEHTYYFGGHRPINGLYNCINDDRYVQIHNPRKQIICEINQNEPIFLDDDILELSPYETEEQI